MTDEQEFRFLAAMFQTPEIYGLVRKYLHESHFRHKGAKGLLGILSKCHEQMGQTPTLPEACSLLAQWTGFSSLSVIVQENYIGWLKWIYEVPVTRMTVREIVGWLLDASTQKWVLKTRESLTDPEPILKEILALGDTCSSVLAKERPRRLMLLSDEYLDERARRFTESPPERHPVGWPALDKATAGGIWRGGHHIIVGPAGFGKTFKMLNLAANALKQGRKVAYIDMDGAVPDIEGRIYAIVSGLPIHAEMMLADYHEAVRASRDALHAPGAAFVYLPVETKSLTVSALRALLRAERERLGGLDEAYIDLMDQINPDTTHSAWGNYAVHEAVADGLRGLGRELDVTIRSATWQNSDMFRFLRQNRKIDPNDYRPNQADIGGASQKAGRCDLGTSLLMNRIEVWKSRFGPCPITIPAIVDFSRGLVKEDDSGTVQYGEVFSYPKTQTERSNGKPVASFKEGGNRYKKSDGEGGFVPGDIL